ncbi:hypothetical protein TNCT_66851 [Trichonephila clavata]|uniref:Uncharacterized protein n=1 Tax=Trichonephila clavata TaxID=2740835 RepID=A0A8X6JAH9_TRICU|nr:hypothetical protein TNCT_66851 [Trichonephila clavata]
MPSGKCEVFIIAIVIVYCVCLQGTGTNALKENKFVKSDLAILENELLQNYEPESGTDEEDDTVSVNSTESNVLQQAECRCKNGRCVKDGIQEVCECFPEFAKINATDCKSFEMQESHSNHLVSASDYRMDASKFPNQAPGVYIDECGLMLCSIRTTPGHTHLRELR